MPNLRLYHICVMQEAAASASRTQHIAHISKTRQAIWTYDFSGLVSPRIHFKPTDLIPTSFNFGMQFAMVLNNLQTIITNEQQLGGDTLVWSTKGSLLDTGVGVRVTGSRFKFFKCLESTSIIYHISYKLTWPH